ncbi:MAG: hypothetical protein BWY92_00234 [Firmicutes bacterium ADurb.BinA052]|nr:MAG: hypothetical protein BWY92_00234 [Firmicutes bacterium ADurb.BinA052]
MTVVVFHLGSYELVVGDRGLVAGYGKLVIVYILHPGELGKIAVELLQVSYDVHDVAIGAVDEDQRPEGEQVHSLAGRLGQDTLQMPLGERQGIFPGKRTLDAELRSNGGEVQLS